MARGGQLLLPALGVHRSPCSTGTRPTPTSCSPRASATRRSGSSARASRTSRSPAPRSPGACRCRGTRATSSTSGTTRSSTTPPPSATAPTTSASTTWWPVVHHLHRQGHPAVPLRVLAGDAAGRRHRAARRGRTCTASCSSAARRCRKTRLNQIVPADLVADFGVDGFRYHFLRDTPFGPDGDFSYEGMVDRYNTDLANNLGNLLSRVATVVGKKCGGVGPAPRARQPARRRGRRGLRRDRRRRGPSVAPVASPSRPRGGSSARPTPTSRPTSRGRSSRAPRSTPCWATPSRCCASSPSWPAGHARRPASEVWRRIGLPGSPADQRLPEAAAWGGYPGGLPVEKGDAALPPHDRAQGRLSRAGTSPWPCAGPTTTATSTATAERGPSADEAVAAARAAGVERADHGRHRRGVVARRRSQVGPRPRRRVGHRRRAPPRRQGRLRRPRGPAGRARGRGRGGVRPRLPLRPLAPRRAAGRRSPPRSPWPTPTTWPS